MTAICILLVEDEGALRRFLVPTLVAQGYHVLQAATAAEGTSLARSHNPDLVLLDLGLPDADGLTVLADLRTWSHRPVIILSARSQEREKVKALDGGADDYLTKPFGAPELLARIRVALRHASTPLGQASCLAMNGLRMDLERREVSVDGRPLKLTPLEYRLLEALVKRDGRLATHQQLLLEVWGPGAEGQTHYLRIYMAQLRRKMEDDPARPRFFLTETGVGYRMVTDDGAIPRG
jgi:two-component system KDP operon response regulator KdpE